MALETRLLQKLSQSLMMTPQLQQAIKLLQLGRLEFKEAIEKEMLENPVLEELKDEDGGASSAQAGSEDGNSNSETGSEPPHEGSSDSEGGADAPQEPKMDWEGYLENYTDYRASTTPRSFNEEDERPQAEVNVAKPESLVEHLISQARLAEIPKEDETILLHVIGNLDRDGYLRATFDEIAKSCEASVEHVQQVVDLVRTFDPPGITARDLKECLMIQLEHMGLGDSLEARIINSHLDLLGKRKYDSIAKAEQIPVEAVYKAVTAIQSLEPRPGRPFSDETARYITPDIYVQRIGNEFVISLNEDGMPKLRISPYYLSMLRAKEGDDSPNRQYLNERLKAATWLIKSIHQRQQTMYRVTESIVKFQREFLLHGISKLKPLVLKDVADDIGMHESTVSRVTTNKYVHTPQGVLELKFFFTTGIKTAEGEVSSSSIKEKIRALIQSETPDDPLSDQKIVDSLKAEHVDIARRTVAKYREALGIESSSRRKKLF